MNSLNQTTQRRQRIQALNQALQAALTQQAPQPGANVVQFPPIGRQPRDLTDYQIEGFVDKKTGEVVSLKRKVSALDAEPLEKIEGRKRIKLPIQIEEKENKN